MVSAVLAVASLSCETRVTTLSRRGIEVRALATEPGASRLLLAPGGGRAAIERAGSTDVVAVQSGAVEATAEGVPIGPPDDDGRLVYLAPAGAGWSVHTTADRQREVSLVPPPGDWRVEAGLGTGPTRVVILAGSAQRWIATLGTDLAVRASTLSSGARVAPGPTAALSPDGARLYLLSRVGDGYQVTALSTATLTQEWATTLEPPPRQAEDSPKGDAPAIRVEIGPWGDRPGFLLQPDGEGSRLLVVAGETVQGGIAEPPVLLVIETAGGRIVSSRRFRPTGPFLGQLRAAAPVPRTSRVVLLHLSRFREGGAETPTSRFGGLSRFDLSAPGDPDVYLARDGDPEVKAMLPSALAVLDNGTVLLAR